MVMKRASSGINMGHMGTSLAVQWLRFHASNKGAWVQSLIRELRSHMPW